MNLSEHFTKEEFEHSDTAKAKGISNVMNDAETKMAIHTCTYLLEPIRKLLNDKYKVYYGKPVKSVSVSLNSGFRGVQLNKAVGGVATSQHCKAQAADIRVTIVLKNGSKVNLPYANLYDDIKTWVKNGQLTVDQCICEHSGSKTWVHVSLCDQIKNARKEFLRFNNGKYTLDCRLK